MTSKFRCLVFTLVIFCFITKSAFAGESNDDQSLLQEHYDDAEIRQWMNEQESLISKGNEPVIFHKTLNVRGLVRGFMMSNPLTASLLGIWWRITKYNPVEQYASPRVFLCFENDVELKDYLRCYTNDAAMEFIDKFEYDHGDIGDFYRDSRDNTVVLNSCAFRVLELKHTLLPLVSENETINDFYIVSPKMILCDK